MLFVAALIGSCSKFEEDNIYDVFDIMPLTTNYPLESDTYDTTIKLSATIGDDQPDFTSFGFYVSTDKELLGEDINVEASEIVDSVFSAWIDDLERDTRYFACAYGISDGSVTYGSTISFTTSTESIPEIVFAGDAIIEKLNAIDIYLFCNIDEEQGATREQIRRYGVRYWEQGENKDTATTMTIASGSSGFYYDTAKGLMLSITNINPNTVYDYEFFAYSTPAENVRAANIDDDEMEGAECLTPVVTDFDAQYVGNNSIRVFATVEDTGNDPVLEYGFRLKSSNDVEYTVDQRVSPDYDDDTRAANDTDFSYYFEGLTQNETYTIEVYAINTILRDYGDGETMEDCREDKSFTTTTIEESIWNLSDFSVDNYPSVDNWAILKGSDYAGVATAFDGLDAALGYIWENEPERRVKITLVDFETLPGSALNFGSDSTILTLEEITFSSASALNSSVVQYCMGVKKVSAPYAESLAQQAICNNPLLEEVYAPKVATIIGARALCNNPNLTRVNSNVDGELIFEKLTTNLFADMLSNGAGSISKITSIDMPLLEEVTTSGSIFGTHSVALLKYLSLPSLEDGTYVFTSTNLVMEELVIPKMKIMPASAFDSNTALTTITAPELVTIGNNAFDNCTAITFTTDMLENVVSIGDYGFYKCANITGDLYLPNATAIGQFSFEECDGLTGINIPLVETLYLATFRACDNVAYADMESAVTFNKDILKNCQKMEWVNLPKLQYAGETTFQNCYLLTELDLPELLATTATSSFSTCTSLKTVNMPKLATVGATPFTGCTVLETVNLASLADVSGITFTTSASTLKEVNIASATSLAASAFQNCKVLTTINVESVESIGGASAFNACTLLESISMPKLKAINGNSTFINCTSLKDVTLTSLETIDGTTTFSTCSALESISLPSLKTIGATTTASNSTFIKCYDLVDVDLPALVSISGTSTFESCTSLESISIPLLTTMGNTTFKTCTSLKKLNLPAATTLGTSSYVSCTELTHIYLGSLTTLDTGVLDISPVLEYAYLPKLESFTGASLLSSSLTSADFTLEVATSSTISSFGTSATVLPTLSGTFTLVSSCGSNGTTFDNGVWSVPYSSGTATYSGITYVEDTDTSSPYIAYDDVQ